MYYVYVRTMKTEYQVVRAESLRSYVTMYYHDKLKHTFVSFVPYICDN